ncbi:hypothetical protein C0J52_05765 [Blattella germanica]|nr:hypothetical protein C0J52_05765 [Blattella germanica]
MQLFFFIFKDTQKKTLLQFYSFDLTLEVLKGIFWPQRTTLIHHNKNIYTFSPAGAVAGLTTAPAPVGNTQPTALAQLNAASLATVSLPFPPNPYLAMPIATSSVEVNASKFHVSGIGHEEVTEEICCSNSSRCPYSHNSIKRNRTTHVMFNMSGPNFALCDHYTTWVRGAEKQGGWNRVTHNYKSEFIHEHSLVHLHYSTLIHHSRINNFKGQLARQLKCFVKYPTFCCRFAEKTMKPSSSIDKLHKRTHDSASDLDLDVSPVVTACLHVLVVGDSWADVVMGNWDWDLVTPLEAVAASEELHDTRPAQSDVVVAYLRDVVACLRDVVACLRDVVAYLRDVEAYFQDVVAYLRDVVAYFQDEVACLRVVVACLLDVVACLRDVGAYLQAVGASFLMVAYSLPFLHENSEGVVLDLHLSSFPSSDSLLDLLAEPVFEVAPSLEVAEALYGVHEEDVIEGLDLLVVEAESDSLEDLDSRQSDSNWQESTTIYMYADIILGSPDKELQRTFTGLIKCSEDNGLKMNMDKTLQMIFRKGGRTSADSR